MDTALYEQFYVLEDHYWWSVGTRAIFREWLAPAIASGTARVLDLGCGTGALARELGALGRVTAVDLAPEAMTFSRRRGVADLCRASSEQLPFADARFDAVVAVDVIEHTDDQRTVPEIARVLRRGGVALVHVPAFQFLWGQHDEVNHHRRRYRRATLLEPLRASGLRVERLSYLNALLFPITAVVRVGTRLLRAVRPSPPRPDIFPTPEWVNRALGGVLDAERRWIRHHNLPFGVSLLCLARKE
jgi:SAM-dependent methyltransferase